MLLKVLRWAVCLLLPAASLAQQLPPDSMRSVTLPTVAVQGHLRTETIGTLHARYIPGVRSLTPGAQCVVWLAAPDSGRSYSITSLTIPLHQRYTAGRLRVSLHSRGRGSELLGPMLLPQSLVFTPPDTIPKRRTQLRLNLRPYQLQLPSAGVYVVLTGEPTQPDEQFRKLQSVPVRKTRKDGSTVVRMFILSQRGNDTTTIRTDYEDYPKLRQSPAGYVATTWTRWSASLPLRRESVHSFRGKSVQAFDTVVLLELESVGQP